MAEVKMEYFNLDLQAIASTVSNILEFLDILQPTA